MSFRSLAGSFIRRVAERQGVHLVRLEKQFGIDPFIDARRLSHQPYRPLDNFFDVGANDGDTAVRARKCFPDLPIFSFEPYPATYELLMKRMEGCPHFTGVNLALGPKEATLDLYVYEVSTVNSFVPDMLFVRRRNLQATRLPVQCITLDAYCRTHGITHVGILKIDTEGFDLEVLRGAEEMLSRKAISFIYVEFLEIGPDRGGTNLLSIDAFLKPFGYKFFTTYLDNIRIEDANVRRLPNALFLKN
jgi:FkbM family methyltransferase